MRNKEYIIIGNGPSAIERELGERIDSYKHVVRIGKHRIKGFEKQIGTKTTYWFSLTNDSRKKQGVKKILCSIAAQKLKSENPHDINYIQKHVIRLAYKYAGLDEKDSIRPTLGLLTIAHCLFSFQWPVVHIIGFDHCNPNEKKHYWEKDTDQVTYTYHRAVNEKRFVDTLVNNGRIIRI